jgi:putative MATE family efflux protein
MTSIQSSRKGIKGVLSLLKLSLTGENQDYTTGSIRRAIFLLAIPMMLEMLMESLFAVVDIFFVGKLGSEAVSAVGLTESMLTIVYSVAIGLSMAATAMVARRVGEKNPEQAARSAAQAMLIGIAISVLISMVGIFFAADLLELMGASSSIIATGTTYTRIALGSNVVIMLLFLINGIFRGAGDASIAMRSLIIANVCNIIFCPIFIQGLGPIPALGLTGAAVATLCGRSLGVLYQLYHLLKGNGVIHLVKSYFVPVGSIIKAILDIAWTGTLQFIIASGSWIFMVRIISGFGETAIAGYTLAIRLIIFFIMPAWGLSNAAATLVGQNLGAQQPERAEQSVWQTAKYSTLFMIGVSLLFWFGGDTILSWMNNDAAVVKEASTALRIISLGYVFYGVGMVVTSSFNGAGDTKTPTWINFFGFWLFQIPMAYLFAKTFNGGTTGVFLAILLAETAIAIAGIILFKKGKWKKVQL